MDPSCSFLVCSYSNRSICIYDLFTGEIVARAAGHGEVVTGLIFVPDCKHIISVSYYQNVLFIYVTYAVLHLCHDRLTYFF